MQKTSTQPTVLAAQHQKQKYHKPSLEVIDINMESPLLSGSGTPTSKKTPDANPIIPGSIW